jgi:hypothetical protein
MTYYYYVNAALPPLALGTPPELSFKELRVILSENLTPEDLKQVAYLLRPIDLANIRAFWMGLPMDDRGNYSPKELEEALLVPDHLPEYLVDFLERYDSVETRLRNFPSLYASLYRETQVKLKGFLLQYYIFERDLRLVLTGLRAKRAGRDLVRELQFEEPTDSLVADLLAQKDSPEYNPPVEYEGVKALFIKHAENPKELNRALLEVRFAKYEELEENQYFSLDRILSYIARLLIVESHEALKPELGRALMDDLSKYG